MQFNSHFSQHSVNAPFKADEHILALSNRHQVDFFSLCSLANNVEVQSVSHLRLHNYLILIFVMSILR